MLPVFDPPSNVSVGAPFWEGIEAGELRLPRGSHCHRWQRYPDDAGPDCEGASSEWMAVGGGGGIVHTMVRVNRSFLPGVKAAPYVVGLAEFREADGTRRPVCVPPPSG
jgi:uncharacterized OB-fold protein